MKPESRIEYRGVWEVGGIRYDGPPLATLRQIEAAQEMTGTKLIRVEERQVTETPWKKAA